MLKFLYNRKVAALFLEVAGCIIIAYFIANTYPVGHWMGVNLGVNPAMLGAISGAVIGICMFIMFFHKEFLKKAAYNHTSDTGDKTFKIAFQCFVFLVLGLELASVAFRWIILAQENNFKMGYVILALGCLGIGLSIVLGKLLHAMHNPTPARAAANLRDEAGRRAAQESVAQLPYLTNVQKRMVANANNSPLDNVRDERAQARENEVKAVEERRRREEEANAEARRREEEEMRINEEMYQKMISPPDPAYSSNGHSKPLNPFQ